MTENQPQKGVKEPDFHDEQQYSQPAPQQPPAQQPQYTAPMAAPSRALFIAASIGMFMMAAIMIVIVNVHLLEGTFITNLYGIIAFFAWSSDLPVITLVLCIILFVGIILALLGFYGFFKYYRIRTALATFIYGIIAASLFLIGMIFTFVFPPSTSWGYLDMDWSSRMGVVGLILLSILFILIGVTFIIGRRSTDFETGSALAGVLFIIAGAFTINPYFSLQFGYFLLLVAAVMGGLMFLMVTPSAPQVQVLQPPQTPLAQPPPTQTAQPPQTR